MGQPGLFLDDVRVQLIEPSESMMDYLSRHCLPFRLILAPKSLIRAAMSFHLSLRCPCWSPSQPMMLFSRSSYQISLARTSLLQALRSHIRTNIKQLKQVHKKRPWTRLSSWLQVVQPVRSSFCKSQLFLVLFLLETAQMCFLSYKIILFGKFPEGDKQSGERLFGVQLEIVYIVNQEVGNQYDHYSIGKVVFYQIKALIKYRNFKMNFPKFHNVSKIQENAELITNHLSKAEREITEHEYNDSPTYPRHHHSQTSSPVRTRPLDFKGVQEERPFKLYMVNQRPNLLSPKVKTYEQNPHQIIQASDIVENRFRKYSDSNAIEQRQQWQKQDENVSTEEVRGSPERQQQIAVKNRKGSLNLQALGFLKRPKRKNSDFSKPTDHKREIKLLKKNSLGWDENNNFQFGGGFSNSEDLSQDEIGSPSTFIPKFKGIRRQSEHTQTPKKGVPSFLTSSKHHRNSLNGLQSGPQSKLVISDFSIIKQLGKGAFGRVVLAVQKTTRMICAIKIMAKREIRENNMLEQLVREMKIQLYVNHPNIVKFYGFFDDLLHCYILMECALDGHLSEYLKKTPNPLSEVEAANYLNQLCSAVALLHSSRIIHRDLKPQNVLLHEGIVKLCDFGWSVHRDHNLRTTFCGTPVYLCPQILVGDEYDESVDIWTIGVILYFMLYKKNPFGISCREELINILNNPIDFDPAIVLSPSAKNLIEKCLSKRAIDRPNIRQLLLHEFLLEGQTAKEQRIC